MLIVFFLLLISKAAAETPAGNCSLDQLLIRAEEKNYMTTATGGYFSITGIKPSALKAR